MVRFGTGVVVGVLTQQPAKGGVWGSQAGGSGVFPLDWSGYGFAQRSGGSPWESPTLHEHFSLAIVCSKNSFQGESFMPFCSPARCSPCQSCKQLQYVIVAVVVMP